MSWRRPSHTYGSGSGGGGAGSVGRRCRGGGGCALAMTCHGATGQEIIIQRMHETCISDLTFGWGPSFCDHCLTELWFWKFRYDIFRVSHCQRKPSRFWQLFYFLPNFGSKILIWHNFRCPTWPTEIDHSPTACFTEFWPDSWLMTQTTWLKIVVMRLIRLMTSHDSWLRVMNTVIILTKTDFSSNH